MGVFVSDPVGFAKELSSSVSDSTVQRAVSEALAELAAAPKRRARPERALLWQAVLAQKFELLDKYAVDFPPFDLRDSGFQITAPPIGFGRHVELPALPKNPTNILGRVVDFPFGVPASVVSSNSVWLEHFAARGADILTYKTVRSKARERHPWPNWAFLPDDLAISPGQTIPATTVPEGYWPSDRSRVSMANSFGVPSMDPKEWQADVAKAHDAIEGKNRILIVSVIATDAPTVEEMANDYLETARLALSAGAHAIELNLSCPNTRGETTSDLFRDVSATRAVVQRVRSGLGEDAKLVLKLGYLDGAGLDNLFEGVSQFVDGFAAINTIPVPIHRSDGSQYFPGESRREAGISGFAIRKWGLEVVRSLARLRAERPTSYRPLTILGMGGVLTPDDALQYYDAGADGVLSCTGLFLDPRLAVSTRLRWPAHEHRVQAQDLLRQAFKAQAQGQHQKAERVLSKAVDTSPGLLPSLLSAGKPDKELRRLLASLRDRD